MMLAMFRDEAALQSALAGLREHGTPAVETYTPAPLQDAPTASPVPLVILAAGLLGAAASFALQAWSSLAAYHFDIGGRPELAWPSFIPTAFENGVLIAVVAGFAAFMILNGLPRLYSPVDEWDAMRRATRDRWFVEVAGGGSALRETLTKLGAISVAELP